jgi:hypothetical protein
MLHKRRIWAPSRLISILKLTTHLFQHVFPRSPPKAMPALSPDLLQNIYALASRSDFDNSSASAGNGGDTLQVICAWPVSGQYGIGSRALYYVLVATCVLAKSSETLRNASLAAALLFPAVAAIHAIVLVCLHVDGAVDMDIFGAFQLCAIGIKSPFSAKNDD